MFVGSGVSGGEEGARYGPSLMPGGNPKAWPHIKPIFQVLKKAYYCIENVMKNFSTFFLKKKYFFRQFVQKLMVSLAAIGLEKLELDILLKWYTMELNTEICS